MASRTEKDIEHLKKAYINHKGGWLTDEVVAEFQKLAVKLPHEEGQAIGEKRKLCIRLMEEYGVTELEAVNIINGNRTSDYVTKYHRIQNQIPLMINNDKEGAKDEEE